jgi:hypothetical protein
MATGGTRFTDRPKATRVDKRYLHKRWFGSGTAGYHLCQPQADPSWRFSPFYLYTPFLFRGIPSPNPLPRERERFLLLSGEDKDEGKCSSEELRFVI